MIRVVKKTSFPLLIDMDQVIWIKKAFHTFTILHLKLFSIWNFPTKKKRGWDFSARWDFDWIFMKKKWFSREICSWVENKLNGKLSRNHSCITLKNAQIYFKNLAVFTPKVHKSLFYGETLWSRWIKINAFEKHILIEWR